MSLLCLVLGAPRPAAPQVGFAPHFFGTLGPGDLEVRVDGQRALLLESTAGSPNLVAGHPANTVWAGRVGVTIGGGGDAGTFAHRAWGDYATIGGGRRNEAGGFVPLGGTAPTEFFSDTTVRGGDGNRASALAASVGGGWFNVASESYATVAGGALNEALGVGSTVTGGRANRAVGDYSTIPGGRSGLADHYGQLAFSAGAFAPAEPGTAQSSLYVLRKRTLNATPTRLALDGLSERLFVSADRALAFRIVVVARSSMGESAGYTAAGVIANQGGTTALVATPSVTVLGEDVASWDFGVLADNVNDALALEVTGAANTNVRWVATVETTEVAQ